ncbi:MAG: HypC/HybG/HupF family hydrogenase formation chaperone [Candidatus Aminicenantes bacterium]|nr:HypC/HybG/HupF family hydrogenase formation chaperone [Candidatus Aminicenantes bacterium]
MCLAVPVRVVAAGPHAKGRVDYLGTKMSADLSLLDGVRVGDWVIVHAGFAIARLDEEEARKTLDLLKEMAAPPPRAPGAGRGSGRAKPPRPRRGAPRA